MYQLKVGRNVLARYKSHIEHPPLSAVWCSRSPTVESSRITELPTVETGGATEVQKKKSRGIVQDLNA